MTPEQRARYHAAAHAVQSGVAHELEAIDPSSGSPKHLRTGVNLLFCGASAMVKLLVAKGIITEAEYDDALIAEIEAEQTRYEARLSEHHGRPVRLG
jgi:hypothetical protein